MRKPIAALTLALGLWLGPHALAGDDASNSRPVVRGITTPEAQSRLVARYAAAARTSWFLRLLDSVAVATPPPVYSTYGIIDEPDPTSSRDRTHSPGFGHSGGDSGKTPPGDSGSTTDSTTVTIGASGTPPK